MEKRTRRGMTLYLIVVCCCIIGLLAGISLFRQKGEKSKSEMEQKLEVQKEALEQLKEDEGEYNEKNIILSDTTKAEAEGLAESIGAKVRVTKNGKVAVLYLDGDKDIKQVYKNKKYLNYIGKMNPDYYGTLSSTSGIKGRSFTSLADNINLKDTWNQTKGSGTKIAVIDTGIDTDSKYLSSKISEKSFDATTGKVVSDYDISVVEERDQMTSHGTSVASAIAADWDENTGIGGIAPDTELVVINVMSSGEILSSDVIFGISYAIECDVDVINMSFSFEGEKNPFEKYTQLAVDSDIICVAAAGNYSTSTPVWPAADENVIGVGAVNQGEKDESGKMQVSTTIGGSSSEEEQKEFTLSEKSDYGDNVDIVAPDNLKVVNAKGEETILGGTSASSATVAGAVALYLSQNTHEEFSKVKETLYAAGKDMGTPGIDWYYGCGMLDVDALVVEEKGTITYDYLTEELSSEKHIFVRGHILQDVPEPERNYAVFDGWYHDINCTEEWDNLEEVLHEDVTMYAAWANEDDTDAFSYTILEDGTAEIKSYRGKRRYLTIPNRIDGYTVSSIGTRAFVGNSRLRRVELPDTLKTIKEYAFSSCTRLLQIEIPSSVVEIQHHAFSECPRLGAVSIPENGKLTTIGDYAFQECGSLPRIDLPAMLQSVNATAFFKDNSLKKITISEKNTKYDADGEALYQKQDKRTLVCYVPGKSGQYVVDDSTESIGKYAFAYSRLSGVTLPDSLTKLENYSFVSSRIEKITIPGAIEAIPEGCFNECNNLQTVSLGKNLTSIGEYAFTNCQNLEEVQVPKENNIQSIGMNAFYACVKLNNIDFIKSKVSTIDSGAFAACYSVKEVTLPKTLKVLGDRAFVSCYNLETVVFEDGIGLDKLREWTFNGCEALKNIVLPEGLQEIGEDCFLVSGLEFIHIPSTVTNIGYGAFGHCLSMKKIEVDNASKNYKTIDNVLFKLNDNGEPAILHTYPAGLEGEYKVPDEVTEIAESAFYAANKLTNISFGQNLQKIGRYAFRYISSLTSLEFNANLQEIGEYAFEECGSLTDVKLNENLVTLKTGAFSFCWKLKNINIPDKLQTIEPYCFTYCEDLESIHIAKGVVSIGMQAFSGDTNLTEITFAKDGALSRLNNKAFAYCGITAMTIPSSIQSMGEEVFKNCTKLESVTFEENSKLNALTAWAFAGADNLKRITFKENAQLTMIQARALERMNSLQTVDVSKCTKLTTIDNYAFYGCASMESFAIPANVTEIGRYAFYGCKKFTRLDIPEKMDTIGRYAFAGIPDIKIYFNSAVLPAHLQEYWDYGIRGYYLGTGETHSNADWKYTVLNDGTAVLIEYIGTNTEVNVTTVDGYAVSAVGANVLKEDSTVQSLTLPESVKSICNYAFENTKNLRNISIPASVEMIGTYAFYKSGVEKVNFASDSKLTYIDAYAFSETENLKNINIPEKVTEVRKYAFESSALNEVKFAQNAELNLIGRYAFSNSKLQEVQLPDHALKVDYHAFDGITSLNTLKFGTGNTQLYGYAFYNTGLTEVNLPENVEYVGEYCFSFCKELTAINVEEANTQYSSEKGVFFNKKQTKLIQCPAGKSGTYNIPDKTEALGFGAFEGSILSKIGISNSSKLNTIGYKAFYDCEQITSMYIPATLVSVDYYAFAYCKKLSDFTLGECSVLKGIYEGAFYGCEALQSIEIPDGVVEIGEYAFYGCEALNSVDIKETSDLQGIYAHAFDYTGLTEFTIPDTVNEVGQYAFAHGKYTQFTTGTGLKEMEEGILFGNDKISEITLKHLNNCDYATLKYLFGNENSSEKAIPQTLKDVTVANATIIPEGYFRNYEYIEKVTLNDVQTIGAEAFAGCKDLKEVTGSESLTSIEEKAFYDCTELTSIENLEQVKEYKDSVFENCQKLNVQENIFTNAVSIGNSAFKECDVLQKAVFSEKLQKIGNDSFRGCDELQEVTIPDTNKAEGVTLGTNSFASCGKLSKVTLGEGITAIGEAAFCDLPSLYDVKLPSTLKVIEERTFEGAALKYAEISEGTEEIREKAFDQDTINAAWNDNENNIIVWLPRSIKTVAVDAFTNDVMYYAASSIPKNFNLDDKSKIYFNCNNVRENDSLHLCDLGDKTILMYYSGQEKILDLSRFENIQINKIGDAAFCQNEMIKEINLGENCSEIGKKAFWLCKSLENILGAENIVKIGAEAFHWCGELQNINLTDNLKEINAAAFEECYNLKSIGSPTQIAKLESGVFWGCSNLKGVLDFRNTEITDTTTLLGSTGNGNLEILLPDNLEKIGERMFWSSYIPNIEFPDSIKSIGEKAFQYANLQEKLELPSMVEEIGPYAFDHSTVKKLIIPKSAKNIDTTAFAVKDYWEADGTKQNLFVYFEADELPDTLKEGWDDAIKGYALGYQGEKYSNGFSYRLLKDGAEIYGYDGKDKNISLDTIDGYPVVSVAERTFYENGNIENVYISRNVENIDLEAFEGCRSLKKVDIEKGSPIKAIPYLCFSGCDLSEGITLPEGLEEIATSAFNGCGFSEIDLPEDNCNLQDGVFSGCRNLKKITIPKNNKEIRRYLFYGCESLQSVIMPEKVTKIEEGAFGECEKLEKINVPDYLDELGRDAFKNCKKLLVEQGGLYYIKNYLVGYEETEKQLDYVVKEGTTQLATEIFKDCTSAKSITLPEGTIKAIPEYAFTSTNLTSLTIPNSVEKIGYLAFANMTKLDTLSIPTMSREYNDTSFNLEWFFGIGGVNGWKIPKTLKNIIITGSPETIQCDLGEYVESLVFTGSPENIEILGNNIKELNLPERIKSIDISISNMECSDTLTLPDGLEEVKGIHISNLKTLELPLSVKTIDNKAFMGSDCLEHITMPIANAKFSDYFAWDDMLHSAVIPKTLKTIDVIGEPTILPEGYFSYCKYVEKIVLPDTIQIFKSGAVGGCERLTQLNIPKSLKQIEHGAMGGGVFTKISLPEGVEKIADGAFAGNPELIEVNIPATTKELGGGAFRESAVTNLSIKSKNITIEGSFTSMNRLQSIVLPFVGYSSENDCTLKELFQDCDLNSLKQVVLLDSCKTIRENAFEGITGIDIYCYTDADAASWPTGWNNGNRVHYMDQWNYVDFCVDGSTVYSSLQGIGDALKLPPKSLRTKEDDKQYSYTFVGWDVNGDGIADNIFASNLRNFVTANAVYSVVEKDNMSEITANKLEEQKDGSLNIDATSKQTNIQKAVANISGEKVASIAGKETNIKTDVGTVRFDAAATNIIGQKVKEESLNVSIENVDNSLVTGLSKEDALYNIDMTSGDTDVTFSENSGEETTGYATVTIPYTLEDGEKPIVSYINENGKRTDVESVYNEADKTVSFVTSHFSLYSISKVSAETCTISFDANGGEDVVPITKAKGRRITLPACTREEYILEGWKDTDGTFYTLEDSFKVEKDTTLTAQWKEKINIVTFKDSIQLSEDSSIYNGLPKTPKVSIEGLTEGTDYEVSYTDNLNAGTGKVIITGKGNYTGQAEKTFEITAKDIAGYKEAAELSSESYEYDGNEKRPSVVIAGLIVKADYELVYKNNVNAGTAEVIVTGQKNYKGSFVRTYSIIPKSITELEEKIVLSESSYIYDGTEKTPEVSVEGLGKESDYEVSYADNIDVGTAKVSVTGKGNYAGTAEKEFTIEAAGIEAYKDKANLSETSYEYDGTEKKPEVTIEGLKADKDYEVTYEANVDAGEAKVFIRGKGNYTGSFGKVFEIMPGSIKKLEEKIVLSENSYIYDGKAKTPKVSIEGLTEGTDYEVSYEDNISVGTARVIFKGKGNYTDTVEKTFTIGHTGIEAYKDKASLSGTSYEYDGTEKTPEVRIEGLTEDQDYEVSYETNINAGKAKVIIRGKGNYGGSFEKVFEIIPSSIKKLEEKIVLSENSYIYDGKAKTPKASIEGLTEGTDYEVSYEDNINVGTAKVIFKGKGNYTDAVEKTFTIGHTGIEAYKDKANLSETSYEYDGTEKRPEVRIEGLTEGQDYEVSYEANINAGKAKVIVSGRGNYGGSFEKSFEITAKDIAGYKGIAGLSAESYEYDGNEKKPSVEIKGLIEKEDYILTYQKNVNAGTAEVIVTGQKNYKGSFVKTYSITPKSITKLEEKIVLSESSYIYDGTKKTPEVNIKGLSKETDYEVSYADNIDVGTAKVSVTGKGNYAGTVEKEFTIEAAGIEAYKDKANLSETSYEYDGTEKKPEVTIEGLKADKDYEVTYEANVDAGEAKVFIRGKGNYTGSFGKVFEIMPGSIKKLEEKIVLSENSYIYDGKAKTPKVSIEGLTEGTDYEVSYEDNINVGTAKVIFKGKGNYTDAVEKTFTIGQTGIEAYKDKANLSETSYEYDGTEKTPEVRIEGLTEGQDYEVSYEANINAGKAKVIVSGRGNYGGSFEKSFEITAKDIAGYKGIAGLSAESYEYDGNEKKPSVEIKGLIEKEDYILTYQKNVNAGTAEVIVTGQKNYKGSFVRTYSITPKSIIKLEEKIVLSESSYIYDGTKKTPEVNIKGLSKETDYEVSYADNIDVGTAKVSVTGKGNYAGTAEKEFTIKAAGIEAYEDKANLSETSYEYDGTEKKPEVTIEGLKADKDYEVTYEANVDAGEAKVLIRGKGNYTGSFEKVFEIIPSSIKKLEEKIVLSENSYIYDGKAKTPKVSIEGLIEGTDYEVSYKDNINVGTAKVIFKGKGNYTDAVEKTFTIGQTGIEAYKDKANLSETSYEYDGKEKTPEVRIEGLTEGQDYEVSYEANINAGKAKVIISGRGNYGGSFVRTYSITPKSITKLKEKIVLSADSYNYDGKAKQPTVYIGGLKADADYTVYYQNNTNIGMATVVIQGKNNYKGAILKRYSITAALNKTYNISGELYRVVNNASNGSGRVTFKGITAKKTDKKIKTVTVRNAVKIGGCNFKVVAVEQKAFKNFSNITKVTIGNNVETIGKQSFSGCKKLKTLTVGSKVKTIGKQAFSGCKNLKTIIINTPYLTKKSVGAKAFKGIHEKATIKVPKKQKKAYQKFLKSKGIGKKVKIK